MSNLDSLPVEGLFESRPYKRSPGLHTVQVGVTPGNRPRAQSRKKTGKQASNTPVRITVRLSGGERREAQPA